MDSFGDLLPFLIGAAYLLLRFVGAARKGKPSDAPVEPPPVRRRRQASGPSVFQQIVAQLEESLNESPAKRAAQPPAVRSSELPPVRPRSEFAGTEASWATPENRTGVGAVSQGGFGREMAGFEHTATDYEHRRHGFGDPSLEARLSLEEATPAGAFDAGRRAPVVAATPPPLGLATRFRSPQAIREAFVLQTILARRPPLTRRRAGLQPRA